VAARQPVAGFGAPDDKDRLRATKSRQGHPVNFASSVRSVLPSVIDDPAPSAAGSPLPAALLRSIAPEMEEVDRALRASLSSDVALVRQVGEYIIESGGKRLRPAVLVLSARACGYGGRDDFTLAAVIEMIHTATLLHDDVVDDSALRRGHATANAAFGNAASVLVGDFLYSRAFQLMVGVGSMRVLEIVSNATNVIAEGEVLQLVHAGDPSLDEARYLGVIQRKTAKLFEAAAQLGAVLAGAPAEREAALARYGMHLGTAFQLIDDVLDYSGDLTEIGKNLGDDLAEGKMTLPLIRALAVASADDAQIVRNAIAGRRRSDFAPVVDVLARNGALDYARARARVESEAAERCVSGLPASPQREILLELASFAARRTY
jgi:octaprenyl-diphosphate synthase